MAASADKQVARLLNEAGEFGLRNEPGLQEMITDYLVNSNEYSDSDSDNEEIDMELESSDVANSGDEDSDSTNNEMDVHVNDMPDMPEEDVENEQEVDEIDGEIDDRPAPDNEIDEAMGLAQRVYEVGDYEPGNTCQCKCKQRCKDQFPLEERKRIRDSIDEMTSKEKDWLLLGIIAGSINDGARASAGKRQTKDRQATRIRGFFYGQKQMCRDMFTYLFKISRTKLDSMKKHFIAKGLSQYKKSGGRNKHALTFEEIKDVVNYITTFAETHSIPLPGRIQGFYRDDIKVLPSSFTKRSVYRQYSAAAIADGKRKVCESTFLQLWKSLLPYIVICRPMADLCWSCQQNNSLIVRSSNIPDDRETYSGALATAQKHIANAQAERELYRKRCKESADVASEMDMDLLGQNQANSKPIAFHYSFDFAQQIHYPSDPLQPGPIYFKTPRKCGIFGVNAEGMKKQVNYLIDESVETGKGANSVISYIHHFFETYGMGEMHLQLNADNCSGQNKNNFVLWYLAWRIFAGLHSSVSIHFLLAGHTKFFPDWCFGLFKQRFRRTAVSCLQDIVDVVDASSHVNQAQLCGDESGTQFVPIYNWSEFLAGYFRRLPKILSYQHFYVSSDSPGVVKFKELADAPEKEFQLCKHVPPNTLPDRITPKGLDHARKTYLYEQIRQFCTHEIQDLVCPCVPGT